MNRPRSKAKKQISMKRTCRIFKPRKHHLEAQHTLGSPPAWLHPDAKAFWVSVLQKIRVEPQEWGSLLLLCQVQAEMIECIRALEGSSLMHDKRGKLEVKPHAKMHARFSSQYLNLLSRFGLVPGTRGRLLADLGERL